MRGLFFCPLFSHSCRLILNKKDMRLYKLHELVEKGEFSLEFVSEKGERIKIEKCICTNWHSAGNTMNVKLIPSNEIRTIRRITIIKFNKMEVWL